MWPHPQTSGETGQTSGMLCEPGGLGNSGLRRCHGNFLRSLERLGHGERLRASTLSPHYLRQPADREGYGDAPVQAYIAGDAG
jgi:hypothetical protein